ncbi:MAG: PASTA domain-containing protein [Clostridia bacterium]|nr:PASTA domain-containing protein [Clostridia bacterium]
MDFEHLCMGCMSPLQEQDTVCAQCGYPAAGVNPVEYLPSHTVLNKRYLVGRVLEIGGDSAVYIGVDLQDNSRVTIREFFPPQLAQREQNGTGVQAAGDKAVFAECRSKFLTLARAVGRLRDVLVVVPSYDIFEENGTAYCVSEYCEGTSLEKYVAAHGGRLPVEEVRRMFLPLIEAVSTIHATGVLHLALSPKNILVDSEGCLRLKNFAISEVRTQSNIGKPSRVTGCAAPEQYENGAVCTEAADVYGLAASMFFALTGNVPAEIAQRRKKGDGLTMPAEVADAMPPYIKESLYRALRLSPERRTQTAQQLLDELSATQAIASLRETEEEPMATKKKFPYIWLIFGAVVVALAILAVFALSGLGYINFGGTETTTTTTQPSLSMKPTTTTDALITQGTGNAMFEVDSLVGQRWAAIQKKTFSGDMKAILKGYEYSDTAPKGTVIGQTPAAGEKVPRGTQITVIISAGPVEGTMPDVSGWKEEHARAYLEALGYNVGESLMLQASVFDKGMVEKSMPAAGTKVKVGDTVYLYVSNVAQPADPPADAVWEE